MNEEKNVSAMPRSEPTEAPRPWVEPSLVKIEAGAAENGGGGLYDGITGAS